MATQKAASAAVVRVYMTSYMLVKTPYGSPRHRISPASILLLVLGKVREM